ncbi:DNA-binding transcriptional LysR family regulator [Sphingomonas endophytica]|uniref:DNA-binding transcriptional LysR family regulator n=1 Tax=Sphingomonas endophytica TaxID=869719 RepID=A0A7X0JDG1_9SPHN|nr:LysR family transcriptional regulator [Sphingomonas endophytica]MBB6505540.1 DNA-binding transcriptional LysR family regulator [Sphingomonas endophytica]
MNRERLARLSIFAAVVQAGGFRAAARTLGLSPSAVSHAVAGLETVLGLRLLNRSTRSLALTDAGRALLDRVAPALGEIDAAVAEARDSDAAPAGPVRVTMTPLSAHALFAPHLARFVDTFPGITLDLVIDDRFVDTVAEGYDLGVRLGETLRPDMIATRIGGPLRMAAVASPAYLARHGRPATLEDLARHRCLHRRLGAGVYRWEVTRDGSDLVLDALPQTLIVNDDALLRRALCDGAGIGFAIESVLADDLAAGRLVELFRDLCPPFPGFFIYHASRRQMRPAVRATIDFFVAANRGATAAP